MIRPTARRSSAASAAVSVSALMGLSKSNHQAN
jgi:hypothetical protein